MPTEQLLLRLPYDLVRRFKRNVPSRQRSAFVQQLLEHALPSEDDDSDPLYNLSPEDLRIVEDGVRTVLQL